MIGKVVSVCPSVSVLSATSDSI